MLASRRNVFFSKVLKNSNQLRDIRRKELEKFHTDNFRIDDENLPYGICLLFEIMQKRKHELLGYNMEEICNQNGIEVLGTGTFGVVLGKSSDESTIWKVQTFQGTDHFKKEIEALTAIINAEKDKRRVCENLPKLLSAETDFAVELGWKKYKLQCLKLTPRGVPLFMNTTGREEVIRVYNQVSQGMKFLHSLHFIHGDITPKNIVKAEDKYVLVDLGLATKTTDKLKGFQGTIPYAHQDVFEQYPNKEWEPKEEHDIISLKYTLAALLNNGKPTWNMKPFPQSIKCEGKRSQQKDEFGAVMQSREDAVKHLFKENNLEWNKGNFVDLKIVNSSEDMGNGLARCNTSGHKAYKIPENDVEESK